MPSPGDRPATEQSCSEEGLLRAVGPAALAASILNQIIGGGIFVLPAAVAVELGSAAPLAYLVSALVVGLVAVCFARASQRVARSGGPYCYAEEAFGPLVGFLTGILLWLTGVLSSASIAAALVGSAATLLPRLSSPLPRNLALGALYCIFVVANLRGVRAAIWMVNLATAAKLLTLGLFLCVGVFLIVPRHLAITDSFSPSAVGRASLLVIFALSGMETALGISGEVRDPTRSIPRALAGAIVLVVALYVSVQAVCQGVLGAHLVRSQAPLADALGSAGPLGRALVLAGGGLSMLGFLVGEVLGSSRILFGFGRAGYVPVVLAKVHPVTRAPQVAIMVHAATAFGLAVSGSFVELAVLSSIATVLIYIVSCAASIALENRCQTPLRKVTIKLRAAVIPSAAIVCLGWVLSQATRNELLAAALALGIATLFYLSARVARR